MEDVLGFRPRFPVGWGGVCRGERGELHLGCGSAGPTQGSLGGEVSLEGLARGGAEATQHHFLGNCFCAGHPPLH